MLLPSFVCLNSTMSVSYTHLDVYKRQIVDNVDKMDYDNIMKGVPEMEKTILNLFCIEGYSHKEIAEQLEISEGHSRWLLHQGRSIIKKMLEPKGVLVNVKG